METDKNNWLNFFSTIKESNIRFNPKPWANPFNTSSRAVIFSRKDKHGEIARKVDEIITKTDEKPSTWETVSEENQTVMKI